MEKRIALLVVGLIGVCFFSSTVLALSPMGPPRSFLEPNQWAVGIDYGLETMDLEATSTITETILHEGDPPAVASPRKAVQKIKDFKSNIVMGRVGYGISENWDAFVRLGIADGDSDIDQTYPDGAATDKFKGYDGSFGFAWGIGTRATFWENDNVTWGGLLQITWFDPDDGDIILSGDSNYLSGSADIDMWEVQIALGPTWQVDDKLSVYGGPFLHFVNGDFDISYKTVDMGDEIHYKGSGDIEEESQLGGYVGAHWDVRENIDCYIEGQFTGDAWGIGIGAARRF